MAGEVPTGGHSDEARDAAVADRHQYAMTIAATLLERVGDPTVYGVGNDGSVPPGRDAFGQARSQRDNGVTVGIPIGPDHDGDLSITHDRESVISPSCEKTVPT
ncbi:hypothetical protein GCM10010466_08520 [Planomonospora alba]|uniref:Uncharacterized protein n=1 Tax=Planomonospora alba TaxID=161354 RepID=A0ABP6MSV3_9ACTN